MSAETSPNILFLVVSNHIKEARRDRNLIRQFPKLVDQIGTAPVETTASRLAHKHPNRIYCNSEGGLARVILFRDEHKFEAYLETAQLVAGQIAGEQIWYDETDRSEFASFATPQDLEREITHWRTRYDMRGDLLRNPAKVYQVADGTFLHVVEPSGIYCRYRLTDIGGITVEKLGIGTNFGEGLRTLTAPPRQLIAYANPFSTLRQAG